MDRTIVGWIFAESNVLYEKYFKIFSTIVSLFMVVQPTLWFYIAKFRSENNKALTKKYMLYSIITSGVLALGSVFAGLIFQLLVDLWLGEQTFTVVVGDLIPFILYGVIYSLFASLCLICYSTKTLKSMAIGALIVTVLKIVSVIIVKINETSLQWSVIMWIDVGLLVVYILVSSISVIIKKMKGELYVEKAS